MTFDPTSFSGSDIYTFYNTKSNVKRTPAKGLLYPSLTSSQMAYLMSFYDACSSSYAYGYNAWKQFRTDFYNAVEFGIATKNSTYVTVANYETGHVTLQQKADYMESRCEI